MPTKKATYFWPLGKLGKKSLSNYEAMCVENKKDPRHPWFMFKLPLIDMVSWHLWTNVHGVSVKHQGVSKAPFRIHLLESLSHVVQKMLLPAMFLSGGNLLGSKRLWRFLKITQLILANPEFPHRPQDSLVYHPPKQREQLACWLNSWPSIPSTLKYSTFSLLPHLQLLRQVDCAKHHCSILKRQKWKILPIWDNVLETTPPSEFGPKKLLSICCTCGLNIKT